jgi:uncharacterized protein (DUF4415 family)
MKKVEAEPYRDVDFTDARRGPVFPVRSGKTKISIRLDDRILDHFRGLVEATGGGNYQTLINDALLSHLERSSWLEEVRAVVRQELARPKTRQGRSRLPRGARKGTASANPSG